MSDRDDEAPQWSLKNVKSATRDLVNAIFRDEWPSPFAMVDFGLATQEHYEALYYAIKSADISPAELDEAICSGPKLTALVASARSNPHKEIVFETDWDRLPLEEKLEPEFVNQGKSHQELAEERSRDNTGWDLERVGPSTRDLVQAMSVDGWLKDETLKDFGIVGLEHYEAIFYSLKSGEITPAELDQALGNGPKLTELVRAAPSNPHKDVTYEIQSDRSPEPQEHASARTRDRDIDRER